MYITDKQTQTTADKQVQTIKQRHSLGALQHPLSDLKKEKKRGILSESTIIEDSARTKQVQSQNLHKYESSFQPTQQTSSHHDQSIKIVQD